MAQHPPGASAGSGYGDSFSVPTPIHDIPGAFPSSEQPTPMQEDKSFDRAPALQNISSSQFASPRDMPPPIQPAHSSLATSNSGSRAVPPVPRSTFDQSAPRDSALSNPHHGSSAVPAAGGVAGPGAVGSFALSSDIRPSVVRDDASSAASTKAPSDSHHDSGLVPAALGGVGLGAAGASASSSNTRPQVLRDEAGSAASIKSGVIGRDPEHHSPRVSQLPTGFESRSSHGFESQPPTGFESRSSTGLEPQPPTGFESRSSTGLEAQPPTGFESQSSTGFEFQPPTPFEYNPIGQTRPHNAALQEQFQRSAAPSSAAPSSAAPSSAAPSSAAPSSAAPSSNAPSSAAPSGLAGQTPRHPPALGQDLPQRGSASRDPGEPQPQSQPSTAGYTSAAQQSSRNPPQQKLQRAPPSEIGEPGYVMGQSSTYTARSFPLASGSAHSTASYPITTSSVSKSKEQNQYSGRHIAEAAGFGAAAGEAVYAGTHQAGTQHASKQRHDAAQPSDVSRQQESVPQARYAPQDTGTRPEVPHDRFTTASQPTISSSVGSSNVPGKSHGTDDTYLPYKSTHSETDTGHQTRPNQKVAEQQHEGEHHDGRDAALAGAGAAAAGASYAGSRHHEQSTGPASRTIGRHSSNVANVIDPRVQPQPEAQRSHDIKHTETGPASATTGPHSSNIANILDPRVRPDPTKQTELATVGPHQSETTRRADLRIDSHQQREQQETHHYGRDASLAGAGLASAGAAEVSKRRQDEESHQHAEHTSSVAHEHPSHNDYQASTATHEHHHDETDKKSSGGLASKIGSLISGNKDESVTTSHSDTFRADLQPRESHRARNTGLAAGATGAMGYAAHEHDKRHAGHEAGQQPITTSATEYEPSTRQHSSTGQESHTARNTGLAAGGARLAGAAGYAGHERGQHDKHAVATASDVGTGSPFAFQRPLQTTSRPATGSESENHPILHHSRPTKDEKAHEKAVAKEEHHREKEHEKMIAKEEKRHEKEAAAAAVATGAATIGHHHHEKQHTETDLQQQKEATRLENMHGEEEHGKKKGGLFGFLHRDKDKHTEGTESKHHKEELAAGAGLASAGAYGAHEHGKHHGTKASHQYPADYATGAGVTTSGIEDRIHGTHATEREFMGHGGERHAPGYGIGSDTAAQSAALTEGNRAEPRNQYHEGQLAAGAGLAGAGAYGAHEHHKHHPTQSSQYQQPEPGSSAGMGTVESFGTYGNDREMVGGQYHRPVASTGASGVHPREKLAAAGDGRHRHEKELAGGAAATGAGAYGAHEHHRHQAAERSPTKSEYDETSVKRRSGVLSSIFHRKDNRSSLDRERTSSDLTRHEESYPPTQDTYPGSLGVHGDRSATESPTGTSSGKHHHNKLHKDPPASYYE